MSAQDKPTPLLDLIGRTSDEVADSLVQLRRGDTLAWKAIAHYFRELKDCPISQPGLARPDSADRKAVLNYLGGILDTLRKEETEEDTGDYGEVYVGKPSYEAEPVNVLGPEPE